jgi:aerobic carbon-monoxide dehydrogenase medium subunit
MKSAPFTYKKPLSLSDAIASRADVNSMFIAGGQSLLPMLALRVARTDHLVHIKQLPELNVIEETPSYIRVGAGITHAAFEDGHIPDEGAGLLRDVAADIAYRAIRNCGTIGGSVALADPAADWPLCLIALSAQAVIVHEEGIKTIAVDDLVCGAYETTLREGELITSFIIPKLPANARVGRCKLAKKKGAFAISHAITIIAPNYNKAYISGVRARPLYLQQTSQLLASGVMHDDISAALTADLSPWCDKESYEFRTCHAVASDSIMRALQP